jgi:hypothetical protein
MQFFLDFIKENKRLNELFNTVSENPGHQGTIIRFSDNFLTLYSMTRKIPKDDISHIFYIYERFMRYGYDSPFIFDMPFGGNTESVVSSQFGFSEINRFKQLIPENIDKTFFNPIEVVISIFNDAKIELFEEIIYEYRNDENFRILIERRGRNTFLNSQGTHNPLIGGISISNNNVKSYGTLGGFLKTKDGNIFGLTCSHVASSQNEPIFQPAKYDSNNNREIGEVLLASDLNFCDPQAPCNLYSSQGNMDVTLIQLKEEESCEFSVHELGKINKLKEFSDIIQGMKVEFNGRTTNQRKQLTIGGLCVSYKVAYEQGTATKYACFTNLIELRSIPLRLLGTNYYIQDLPVRAGDSGAWICSNDSHGYSWCGMLISGDSDRGYFLSSEHIVKWLDGIGYSFDI